MSTSTILIVLLAIVIVLFYIIKKRSSKMAPDEFEQKLHQEPGLIIDVRTPAEYSNRHLKRTDYNFDVTSGSFKQKLKKLDKNETYYLYCRTGSRSGRAVKIMQNNGFKKVYNAGRLQQLVNNGFE
jgi:phage shock protein E